MKTKNTHGYHRELSASVSERLALADASLAADAQSWLANLTYRQLSAGQFSGSIKRLRFSDIEIGYECHNQDVQKIGAMPARQCTLSFLEAIEPSARFSQFAQDKGDHLFFLTEGIEVDIVVPGGCAVSYVRLDQSELLRGIALLNEPLAARIAAQGGLQALSVGARRSLGDSLHALLSAGSTDRHDTSRADVHTRRDLHREFFAQLVQALSTTGETIPGTAPSLHARRRALHIVRQARDYMAAQVCHGSVPDILGVCEHTGVSERTLQYAFQTQLSLSPASYLRLVRLNGARAELLSAVSDTTSVTSVAMRWGFLHLSRFARAYRQLFGETPSTTLARAIRA
ncbi:helix-turn-helix domain-containing protein [Halochromatium sp.]